MTTDRQTIEQIVIAAIEKHFGDQSPPRAQPDRVAVEQDCAPSETVESNNCVISDKVVTAEILEAQINGHAAFQIGERAVLTPSAYDYIHEHQLNWSRGTEVRAENRSAAFLAAVVSATPHVSRIFDELAGGWTLELQANTRVSARKAVSAISRGEVSGVAVVSGKPQVVSCLVNRSPKVRAAVVQNLAELNAAIDEIGVNVIAINPEQFGGFQLRQVLVQFSENLPQAPDAWESLSRLW